MNDVPRAIITIRLKPDLLDSQGRTTEDALKALGFGDVRRVRIGKLVDIELEHAADAAVVEEMCRKLLANPVIEDYEVVVQP